MENKEIEKLKQLLLDSELLDELKSRIDKSVNIFDILKITNSEIRHSNILAWLLNPNENHGLGNGFIRCFFSYLANTCTSSDDAVDLLMSNDYSFSVRREWKNIDLLILSSESKIVIAIENKVKSGEHSNQLTRYREIVEGQFKDYRHYFVFLSIEGYESSDPDVWRSIGYENILEWLDLLLERQSMNSETRQILRQYHSVLWREVMGYPKEVIDLCNKIYEKHKDALDLIYENIEMEENGLSDYDSWGEEWVDSNRIVSYERDKNGFYFRTAALEKLFPTILENGIGKWPCYYSIAPIPFPTRVYIEFGSERCNDSLMKKFHKIKREFNDKTLKENWRWHRLKTWRLSEYNLDETDDFAEISDTLKAELERIIDDGISDFETAVKRILK